MSHLQGFTAIGENIHATRIMRRNDPRVGADEHGREAIAFTDSSGHRRHLFIPESERGTAAYLGGKIKHVRVAIRTAMASEGDDAETALAYLDMLVRTQVEAGADFLDLNVDEVSLDAEEQANAMRWLVRTVAMWTDIPVAIDSPSVHVLTAGVEESVRLGRMTMVNSASIERLDALDLAVQAGGAVIVTATGESGMPNDVEGRIENATRIVEQATTRGIPLERIHVDPLVFPVAVDRTSGQHCLAAYRGLRADFGPELRLTGGISNVSFGLPQRHLLNDVFLALVVDAGANSGILDPIANAPERAVTLDRESASFRLAAAALTGADPGCRTYLKAHRAGELTPVAGPGRTMGVSERLSESR